MTDLMAPVPTDNWDHSLQPVIEAMKGSPLNIHKLLANNPALLRAWWPYRQHIVSSGALGKRNAELAILRTAALNECWYEWAAHVERGLKVGLGEDDFQRIAEGSAHTGWSADDRLLLEVVDALFHDRRLLPEMVARFETAFDRQALLDLIAIQGTYQMLANILNTWETPLDPQIAEALPESITRF